jgi:hypothetical protein
MIRQAVHEGHFDGYADFTAGLYSLNTPPSKG